MKDLAKTNKLQYFRLGFVYYIYLTSKISIFSRFVWLKEILYGVAPVWQWANGSGMKQIQVNISFDRGKRFNKKNEVPRRFFFLFYQFISFYRVLINDLHIFSHVLYLISRFSVGFPAVIYNTFMLLNTLRGTEAKSDKSTQGKFVPPPLAPLIS